MAKIKIVFLSSIFFLNTPKSIDRGEVQAMNLQFFCSGAKIIDEQDTDNGSKLLSIAYYTNGRETWVRLLGDRWFDKCTI